MQSPISGSFGGLPPHNLPFRGCQHTGEALVIAAHYYFHRQPKLRQSGVIWSCNSVSLSFPLLFFSHPSSLPAFCFALAFITRLRWQPVYQPGCGGGGQFRHYGRCRRGAESWHYCLPVRSLRPAVAQTICHARNPSYHNQHLLCSLLTTVVVIL